MSLCLPRLSRLLLVTLIMVAALTGLSSAATLRGSVTDPDGRTVPNVRVIARTSLGTVAEALTDTRGEYELPQLDAGRYDLVVVADGLQADPIAVALADDEQRALDIRLRLSAVSESVVVSVAQVDVPLSHAAASVTVVTAAELQARQIVTVADALRFVPGLSVARSGGRGALTSLFPRGGGSNYTLVLVDGMRVNSFGGGYDFAHLSAADVDRIEIARGAASAMFGSDALGAVVQIVTRRGGRPRVDALVEGGSQATARASVSGAGSAGRWTWGAGVERAASDGYTGRAANGERVINDDDSLSRATGTLGWHQPGGADLLFSSNISRDERGFPGPFGSDPSGFYQGVDRVSRGINDTRQLGARLFHPWTPRVRQRLEANYTDLLGSFTSRFGPSEVGTERFDSRIQEDLALSAALGASVGLEVIREQGVSTFVTGSNGQEIPIERNVAGLFAEARVAAPERLLITGGVRLDRLTRASVEADGFQTRPAFPEQTINSFNPKIAVNYLVTPPANQDAAMRVRASAGTGIRPPNTFEIAFTDNPDLKPERSRSLDVGIEQQLGGGAYRLAATAFFNRYDDLIVTIGSTLVGASRYRTDNVSNARARGLELSGDVRVGRGLVAHGAYTFLATEILSSDGAAAAPAPFRVGDALVRRPRHQLALNATYLSPRLTGLTAFVEVLQRSETLDLEPNRARTTFLNPGFAALNAGVSIPVGRRLQLFARGLNLADRQYEETLGFPALRRSGIVGVRVAASR